MRLTKLQYYCFLTAILLPLLVFASQGYFIKWKLSFLEAEEISYTLTSAECDNKHCYESYRVEPTDRLLLLGHVLRDFSVHFEKGGEEIYPMNQQKGDSADNWTNLFVYDLKEAQPVIVKATRPKSARLQGFIGIYPRSTNNEDILSVPDITPTISLSSQLSAVFMLYIMYFAAIISRYREASSYGTTKAYLTVVVVAVTINMLFNSHYFDSVFPDAYTRNILHRTFSGFGYLLPALYIVKGSKLSRISFATSFLFLGYLNARYGRIETFGYPLYFFGVLCFCSISLVSLLSKKLFLISILFSIVLIDAFRIGGYPIGDYPPIYFYQIALLTYGCLIAHKNGALNVILLAKRAYEQLQKDLTMVDLVNALKTTQSESLNSIVKKFLLLGREVVQCEKVSLLIGFPGKPPITFFTKEGAETVQVHDDGEVKGIIFTRAYIYGDSFWFDSVDQLRKDGFGNITQRQEHEDRKYFVALPVRFSDQIVGAIAFTGFYDKQIENKNLPFVKEEYARRIRTILGHFETFIASKMSNEISNLQMKTDQLKREVAEAMLEAETAVEYFNFVSKALSEATCRQVSLYQQVGIKGPMISHYNLKGYEAWSSVPFNLDPKAQNRVGPTIVAFLEGKSSYVRDVRALYDRLHPRTQELCEGSQIQDITAVPMRIGQEVFVWNLYGTRSDPKRESGALSIVEDIRSDIIIGYQFVNQKSSVSALGRLNARLIGDATTRDRVLEYARNNNMPSTVGEKRSSLLLMIDLIGSSKMPDSCERKAELYGQFYDRLNADLKKSLKGAIRKASGDGVIITASPDHNVDIIKAFHEVLSNANRVGQQVGCDGVRMIVHYGEFFFGMVGTQTFAQIDSIGSEIDRLCKLESLAKQWVGTPEKPRVLFSDKAIRYLIDERGISFEHEGEFSGVDPNLGGYYLFNGEESLIGDKFIPLSEKKRVA